MAADPAIDKEAVAKRIAESHGEQFESELRYLVNWAGSNVAGYGMAPWEVVMEAVIELEKRIRNGR